MKKIFLILFLAILLVGTVSAGSFLPVKQYDKTTQTITIVNTLGLGRDISTIKLNTPLIYEVGAGYGKVAEFEIDLFDNPYSNAFKKMEFFDLNNDKEKFERDFDYKYLTTELIDVNDYRNICSLSLNGTKSCSYEIVGTHQEEKEVWKDLDIKTLTKGKVIVGIFTEVQVNDYVEWIPTLFGKKIDEWASWTASLEVGLISYYALNGTSGAVKDSHGANAGTNSGADRGVSGIINNSFDFEAGDPDFVEVDNGAGGFSAITNQDLTINVWINVESLSATSNMMFCGETDDAFGFYTSDAGVLRFGEIGASEVAGSDTLSLATWTMVTITYDQTADLVTFYINGTADSGGAKAMSGTFTSGSVYNIGVRSVDGHFDGKIDELSIYNRTWSQAEVTQSYNEGIGISYRYERGPKVTLNSPVDNYNSSSRSITFNATASDNSNLVNVSLYLNGVLNETNSSGFNDRFYYFTKTFDDGDYNWTIEAWNDLLENTIATRNFSVNTTPDIQFISPTQVNTYNSSSSYVPVNVSLTETYFENITFSFYNNSLTSYFYTDSTRYINKSLADGDYEYNVTVWTTTGQSNTTRTRNITIDTTAPTLAITHPTTKVDYHVPNTNLSLNWTVSDIFLDSCWYNYNGTNMSVTCSDNTTNINITSNDNRNITFWANDTLGHINSTFRSWDYKIFENSHIYNNETYEMETETLSINISSDGSEIIVGYLVYNGTSYIATKTGDNYLMEFDKTITLDQTGNVSFYWSFNYGGEIINSSTFNQSVNVILMGFCGGSLTTQTLNFTTYDEEDLDRVFSYDFYGTFHYWTGDGSVTKNFSVSNVSINETLICINIDEIFHANAQIQYEKADFVKRSYYLVNETLTNSSQDKKLYFLNESSSTSFIIDITDEYQLPVEGAYVYVQRYHAGTDEYITVEIVLTDNSGSSISHFEIETEDYRVIVELDGEIVFQSGSQKIFCRETPCALQFQIAAGEGISWEDFGVIDLFDWTLDYDEGNEVWTFAYTDTSSSIGYGRLYVYYEEPHLGKTTICNINSTLIADTITCDVTGYNGTIYAEIYLSRSPEIFVYMKSIVIKTLKTIFGQEGLFMSMFILLVLALAGLWNPAVGIILTVVGMIILNMTGLASFGAVTLWGVVFIAGIILWKLKS